MDYSDYRSEDFVQDESFVEWVLNPDSENADKWESLKISHPDKIKEMHMASDIIKTLHSEIDENEVNEDVKQVWNNLQPAVRGMAYANEIYRNHKRQSIGYWIRIAAMVTLAVGLSYWYFQSMGLVSGTAEQTQLIEKINPKGRRSTITLGDGSRVILNSESSLSYSSNYGESTRELTLTGEAFFEVAKDPHRPFIVKSGNVSTTALGTSFNVSSFPEDQDVIISLASGKIKVQEISSTEKPFILTPGEQIKYAKQERAFQKFRQGDDAVYLWKDGIISFHQANLNDIKKTLDRWYGVNIEVLNQPKEIVKFNGIFNNQSLENVLIAMSFSLNFEFSIEEENIKIMFN